MLCAKRWHGMLLQLSLWFPFSFVTELRGLIKLSKKSLTLIVRMANDFGFMNVIVFVMVL